jgi:hypothetical protein
MGAIVKDLADIRRRIVAEHDTVTDLQCNLIERAIAIGGLLAQARALVPHGGWIPWVEENCPFERRQAAKYMKAYVNRESLREMTRMKRHLTLEDGLRGVRGLPARAPRTAYPAAPSPGGAGASTRAASDAAGNDASPRAAPGAAGNGDVGPPQAAPEAARNGDDGHRPGFEPASAWRAVEDALIGQWPPRLPGRRAEVATMARCTRGGPRWPRWRGAPRLPRGSERRR